MKKERYKSYFSETKKVESKISTLSLLEDIKVLKNLLKEEDETIQEENPLDNLPDETAQSGQADQTQPEAPTTFSQEESPEDVAEEGVSELLVSIIQKYGLDSEIIDKLLLMGRELNAPTETPEVSDGESSDGDLFGLDTEGTNSEEPSPEDTGEDQTGIEDLLSSYTTGENPEENPEETPEGDLEGTSPEENPEETPQEDQEQTEQERIEAEQKLADEEEEKPLDLANFSFKN
jgi:hypothetical protein